MGFSCGVGTGGWRAQVRFNITAIRAFLLPQLVATTKYSYVIHWLDISLIIRIIMRK